MSSRTPKREWKKGLSSDVLKDRDAKKGAFYRPPGDRVAYFKRDQIKRFIPKEGKNRVRIIQPLEVEELLFYGLEMHFHRSVGDEGEELFGDYTCNRIMKDFLRTMYEDIVVPNKCFVCEQQTPELWDDKPEVAKTFYPDRRMWFFVHDLLSDDKNEVLLWSCPWTLYLEILSRSTNEETGQFVDVSDPTDGPPVSFERQGKGKLTKYVNVQIFTKPHPLSEDALSQLPEFRDILIIPDYETVKKAYLAGNPEVAASKAEEVKEEEPEPSGPPDCYEKEYDKWQDCEACEYAAPCSEAGKEPEKPKKPQRPVRKKEKEEKTPDEKDDKESIRNKIKAAQKSRQGK